MPDYKYQWDDSKSDKNMDDRRQGCMDFLNWIVNHPEERDRLRRNPGYALEMFREHGSLNIPDGVRVFCLENKTDLENLDGHVALIMPPDGVELQNPKEIFNFWLFGWPPYKPGDNLLHSLAVGSARPPVEGATPPSDNPGGV